MEHTQKVGDPGVGTLPPGGAIPEFSRRGVKSGKDFGARAGAIFGLERARWGNWADGECSHSAKERDAGVLSLICESWDSEKRSLTGSPTVTLPFTITPSSREILGVLTEPVNTDGALRRTFSRATTSPFSQGGAEKIP